MSKLRFEKKVYFYSVLILLPFLLIALLEFTLRIFSYGDDLSLFVSTSNEKYLKCNTVVAKRFFSKFEYTISLNDVFLREKPDNGYRIFVLGESTVQGFPYDANMAFSRILQRRFQDLFPDRNIEIINLGLTAISSYTLLDFIDEVIDQEPDLILIYTGHNEYYGALGVGSMENGSIPRWLKKTHLRLVHLKIYQLLQNFISKIYTILYPKSQDEAQMTLMQQVVGKNIIPYKSDMYKEGLVQFRDNMSELLEKLKTAHIPVIISDLVSNVRDLPPFYSISSKTFPSADSLYNDAIRLEADSLFEQAKEKYIKAKDLDAIRFRAPEDLNKIIAELADSFGVYITSTKSLFEKYSSHRIVGNNLMTEHLHPNIDGYFLLSEVFFNVIKEQGMIENNWDTTRIKPLTYYRQNWGYTELDSLIADLRIKHLRSGWPFQPETTINNFIFTYKPKGIIDSLAFKTLKYDNVSSESVHKELAEYYKSNGELRRASKEYLSLAYMYPMNASYYYYSADLAYKAKDYESTMNILNQSPHADTSSFVQMTLASIFYSWKKYKEALLCINKLQDITLTKENFLIAQKLKYKIQRDSGLTVEAGKTFASIKKTDPDFSEEGEGNGKALLIVIPQKVKAYIEEADLLRKNGRLSEAVDVLLESNKIQETAYANLQIGKILMVQKKPDALVYLEKAYKELKDDPSLTFSLSLLYMMKNDVSKAKSLINEFIGIKGEDDSQSKQLIALYEKQFGERW